jgi:hypothetical protein
VLLLDAERPVGPRQESIFFGKDVGLHDVVKHQAEAMQFGQVAFTGSLGQTGEQGFQVALGLTRFFVLFVHLRQKVRIQSTHAGIEDLFFLPKVQGGESSNGLEMMPDLSHPRRLEVHQRIAKTVEMGFNLSMFLA